MIFPFWIYKQQLITYIYSTTQKLSELPPSSQGSSPLNNENYSSYKMYLSSLKCTVSANALFQRKQSCVRFEGLQQKLK